MANVCRIMEEKFKYIDFNSNVQKILGSRRIPHAVLLTGRKGNAKLLQALRMARSLVCSNPNQGSFCDECNSCKRSGKLIHPDIHFSFPTIGKDAVSDLFVKDWRAMVLENPFVSIQDWLIICEAEKKQGNIPKAECSNILKKINLRSFEGGKKVMILWLPEFLGNEGNRLLKLIEEPPENTHFILVSDDSESILGTILSRCQIINIAPVTNEETKNLLVNEFGANSEELESVLAIAEGNLNSAIGMLGSKINENVELLMEFLRRSYVGKPKEVSEVIEKLAALPKQSLKVFFEYFLHFLRQCLIINAVPGKKISLQKVAADFAQNFAKMLTKQDVETLTKEIDKDIYYIERNANIKLLLVNMSFKVQEALKKEKEVLA